VLRPPLRLWLRQAARALNPSPRLRRWLLAALAVALLLGGLYMFWFRDSSFVGVEKVSISGARGNDAGRMREALSAAGRDMSTLHVDRDRLQRAAAGFSSVRTLEVSTDFPHTLRIRVIEHRPVAIAVGDSGRVPVAADGSVLQGVPTGGALPTVKLSEPAGSDRVEEAAALRLVAVVGGAPAVLSHRLTEVRVKGGKGIVVHVRHGPDLIFGDTSSIAAKWVAVTRVLADASARGATYVDVRVPDRPAAGGLPTGTQAPAPEPAAPTAGAAAAQTSAPGQTAPTPPAGAAGPGHARWRGAREPSTLSRASAEASSYGLASGCMLCCEDV
jgi:cell division protein FtsQ